MTVDDLVAKGAVRKGQPVKVLGQGDISVKVDVSAQAFSGLAPRRRSRPPAELPPSSETLP